jgi:hypothetical protein
LFRNGCNGTSVKRYRTRWISQSSEVLAPRKPTASCR